MTWARTKSKWCFGNVPAQHPRSAAAGGVPIAISHSGQGRSGCCRTHSMQTELRTKAKPRTALTMPCICSIRRKATASSAASEATEPPSTPPVPALPLLNVLAESSPASSRARASACKTISIFSDEHYLQPWKIRRICTAVPSSCAPG